MKLKRNDTLGRRCLSWTKLTTALLTTLVLCPAAFAGSTPPNCDRPLRQILLNSRGNDRIPVILKVRGEVSDSQTAQLKKLGVTVVREHKLIDALAVSVPRKNLKKVLALKFVVRGSYDGPVTKSDTFTTTASLATVAWGNNGYVSGNGATIAILDSGLQKHIDFGNLVGGGIRVVDMVDMTTRQPVSAYGIDPCGHGTHVAGIAAGNSSASLIYRGMRPVYGVARAAKLMGVRVLDDQGTGTVSNVIAGIEYVVQNKSRHNVRVMNLSLGHGVGESYTTDPLCQAVEKAWKAGIVVVCAAGNTGRLNAVNDPAESNEGWGTAYGSIQSPANDPYVITVGATKSMESLNRMDDRIATYSSRGPSRLDLVLKPDLIAPGNQVLSTMFRGSYLATNYRSNLVLSLTNALPNVGMDYFVLSGTSMAAPVVAGAAAMMVTADPSLTPDTVKARLMVSADKWTSPTGMADACTYGAGYLNIVAAMADRTKVTQPALSPKLVVDESGNVSLSSEWLAGANRAIWGSSITDLRAIWGSGVTEGDFQVVDPNRAIWGSTVTADRAIWGANSGAVDLTSVAINGE